MFNSSVLEVAIGLVFCYASVALIVSSITEGIASMLQLRAKTLLTGIKSLLNDQHFNGFALQLYNHCLVHPLGNGAAITVSQLKHKPSYINAQNFSGAILDMIQTAPNDFGQLRADIELIQDAQIRQTLLGMYDRAAGQADLFRAQIEEWFDSGMERVSGIYKRRSQLICFLLGFLIAALLNIDSFQVFRCLWRHPEMAMHINASVLSHSQVNWTELKALPIGWTEFPSQFDSQFLIKVAGWLITASSALFGAPFWFDLLQRLTNLRGAGKEPKKS